MSWPSEALPHANIRRFAICESAGRCRYLSAGGGGGQI